MKPPLVLLTFTLAIYPPLSPALSQCVETHRSDSSRSLVSNTQEVGDVPSDHDLDFEVSSKGNCRIEVFLCDGIKLYGDLLEVGDSTLSMYVYRDFSYTRSRPINSGIHQVDLHNVRKIVVKGRSHILNGVFIGFLGGMIAGSVMTRVVDQHAVSETLIGPGALGGMGLIMGGAIGYLSSGNDLEMNAFDNKTVHTLRALSEQSKK